MRVLRGYLLIGFGVALLATSIVMDGFPRAARITVVLAGICALLIGPFVVRADRALGAADVAWERASRPREPGPGPPAYAPYGQEGDHGPK